MKLFVANLSYDVGDEELRNAFEECGSVANAQVITDRATGRSRGFGFVEMESEEGMNAAIETLNGRNLQGREIVVKVAENKPPRRRSRESY
jgi:RNA recognition motif-containing protein